MPQQMKLYRVTFKYAAISAYPLNVRRTPVTLRASSVMLAGMQTTLTDGSDLSNVELLAVDTPHTGKEARAVAKSAFPQVSTRHMLATPAKVLARAAMHPNRTVRLVKATNAVVTFRLGGAY